METAINKKTDTRKMNKQVLDAGSPDFKYADFSAVNQSIRDLETIKNNPDILTLEQLCANLSKIADGSACQYEMVGQTKGKIGKKKVRPSFELQFLASKFLIQEIYQPIHSLKQEFQTLKAELKKERENKDIDSLYDCFNLNRIGGAGAEQQSDFEDDNLDESGKSGDLYFVKR